MTRPEGPGPRRVPARRAPGTGGVGALRQGASPAEGADPALRLYRRLRFEPVGGAAVR